MRNFYLFEAALQVPSVEALEDGINRLNSVFINRDEQRDNFVCNGSIWNCDTTQGLVYELFGGIVNPELQRLVPILFGSFSSHPTVYATPVAMDAALPNDCNAFTGFCFDNTAVPARRRVYDIPTYSTVVKTCLKLGPIADLNAMQENLLALYPSFTFEERALEETLHWKNTDMDVYNKLHELLADIPLHPFTGGIGQTEVLKHKAGVASKRINHTHRLTYRLRPNNVLILACHGHYD